MFRGAFLAPLAIVPILPISFLFEGVIDHSAINLRFAFGVVAPTMIFAYMGMLIFAVPMYLLLRVLRSHFWVSLCLAIIAGFIAAIITPDLLESNPEIGWMNFRTLFLRPFFISLWLNAFSVAGAAVGAAFLLIARPGPNVAIIQRVA